MNFEDALKAMREGKKVKKSDWKIPMVLISELKLKYVNDNDVYLTEKHILAEDWVIVE